MEKVVVVWFALAAAVNAVVIGGIVVVGAMESVRCWTRRSR